MVEFLLLQIITRRFQPVRYFGCSCAYLAFARRLSTDHVRQRFYLLADSGGRLVRLLRGSRAELLCLGRHTGNGPACLVAILLKAPLNLLLGLLASISVLLLDQTGQLVLLTADPVDVVIGEFAPPRFELAAHLLPLSCQDVLIHGIGPDIVFHFQLPPFVNKLNGIMRDASAPTTRRRRLRLYPERSLAQARLLR